MDYFKLNYSKLENLGIFKFSYLLIILLIILVCLLFLSLTISIDKIISCYGIYQNEILYLEIDSRLSDIIKNNSILIFNNKKTTYNVQEFADFEIDGNVIYEKVGVTVEEKFYDNEVGKITICYGKQKIFNYILDLFK